MTTTSTSALETIQIRPAHPGDDAALRRLAALDSAAALDGEVLLAVVGDEALAALDLGDGRVIADPFRHTADLIELLRTRARLLGLPGSAHRRRWHSLRRPSPTVALARSI